MSGTHEAGDFTAGYRRALADAQLQKALGHAMAKFAAARGSAAAEFGDDWERLRSRAAEVKEHTLLNLDYYLELFATNVERLGGKVFWAADAAEANRYVTELALARGVSLVVKGKSMMTEEVGLNAALEAVGVESVETDLGEYIIQLAGERPSHITAPAIHKTRGDVADLFSEKLGVGRTEEISELTATARRVLRERFTSAGMGVTGVNFAVAQTGTIVLVENEGNIRLASSMPRAHVALMGVEKIVPRFEDLSVFLTLLPRSASGQKMTSYVSFLTGLKRAWDDEGPEELHVVVLDNGRTRILADPRLRSSLNCIRCGACLNVCPVYGKIGGHAYGWVYPGPIGAVLTPQLIGRERARSLPAASTLCGACRDACPLKIEIPQMLLHLRQQIKEGVGEEASALPGGAGHGADPGSPSPPAASSAPGAGRLSAGRLKARAAAWAERLAFSLWGAAMRDSVRYRRAAALARFTQRLVPRWLRARDGARPHGGRAAARDLPPLAERSFRELWAEDDSESGPRRA
jgi:L-lactate dehydrogenase complex protein LldF